MTGRFLLLTIAVIAGLFFTVSRGDAQASATCGYIGQQPCNEPGADEPGCQDHATLVEGVCQLDSSGFQLSTAKISQAEDLSGLGISPTADLNCLLAWTCLVIPDGNNPVIPNGRYLYVLKSTDDLHPLVLRRFDRPDNPVPPCAGYRAFDTPDNYRTAGGAYDRNSYQYVRHPQLNGSYASVYGAGELLVKGGVVVAISNGSGHFRPPAQPSLSQVSWALTAARVTVAANVQLLDDAQGQRLPAENPCSSNGLTQQFNLRFENHTALNAAAYAAKIDPTNPLQGRPRWNMGSQRTSTVDIPPYWHTDVQVWNPAPPAPSSTSEQAFTSFAGRANLTGGGVFLYFSSAPGDIGLTGFRFSGTLEPASSPPYRYCLSVDGRGTAVPLVTVSLYRPASFPGDNQAMPIPCLSSVSF
jgi:hypothetical protein